MHPTVFKELGVKGVRNCLTDGCFKGADKQAAHEFLEIAKERERDVTERRRARTIMILMAGGILATLAASVLKAFWTFT
jgi:hypothetical protein